MGRVRMLVEVSGPEVDGADPLGMKEAVTMDLEKYGRVTVSRVEVDGPEQMQIGGGGRG